jgi:hypothetical protein
MFTFTQSSFANELIRPIDIKVLASFQRSMGKFQRHYYVPGSQIAWVNYPALRRDFLQLYPLTNDQIDQWILSNFAYVSAMQLELDGIRVSEIQADKHRSVEWFHPDLYFRSAVATEQNFNIDIAPDHKKHNPTIVDLKGTGLSNAELLAISKKLFTEAKSQNDLDTVRTLHHSDGMISLGEAIAEALRERAIQGLFEIENHRQKTSYQTVESYFIISLPIKILKDGNKTDSAAIYGRQAHFRGMPGVSVPKNSFEDNHGHRQGSIFESIVDFGGAIITNDILISTFGDYTIDPNKDPKSYSFINNNGFSDPQQTRSWIYSHDTAKTFEALLSHQRPAEARQTILNLFETMLTPIKSDLEKLPRQDDNREMSDYLFHRWLTVRSRPAKQQIQERIESIEGIEPFVAVLPRILKKPQQFTLQLQYTVKKLLSAPEFKERYQKLHQYLMEKMVQNKNNVDSRAYLSVVANLPIFWKHLEETDLSMLFKFAKVALPYLQLQDSLNSDKTHHAEELFAILAKHPKILLEKYPELFNFGSSDSIVQCLSQLAKDKLAHEHQSNYDLMLSSAIKTISKNTSPHMALPLAQLLTLVPPPRLNQHKDSLLFVVINRASLPASLQTNVIEKYFSQPEHWIAETAPIVLRAYSPTFTEALKLYSQNHPEFKMWDQLILAANIRAPLTTLAVGFFENLVDLGFFESDQIQILSTSQLGLWLKVPSPLLLRRLIPALAHRPIKDLKFELFMLFNSTDPKGKTIQTFRTEFLELIMSLLNSQIPSGTDDRYWILEQFTKQIPSLNEELLKHLIDIVRNDHDPRARVFLNACRLSGRRSIRTYLENSTEYMCRDLF